MPVPSQSESNPLNLFGQRCLCKRDTPSSSLYQGCGLEMDTSGVRNRTRFQSLHLAKDILDIKLGGWHKREIWDLILWEVHHKFQITGVENIILFHSCSNQYIYLIIRNVLSSLLQHLALDFGVKQNILKDILKNSCTICNNLLDSHVYRKKNTVNLLL